MLNKINKKYLREVRSIIVNSFDAITVYDNIDLTSDKESDFPLSDVKLEEIALSIPVDCYWVNTKEYIKKSLIPVPQEVWHDGNLEQVYYRWELHFLPIRDMFDLFKNLQKHA